jgi:hypothetical protein
VTVAVVLVLAAGCAKPPGERLCEAIATRDIGTTRALLARGEIDLSANQGTCVPVVAVFSAAGPKESALTTIGVELLKSGVSPQVSWPSPAGAGRVFAVESAAGTGNLELVRAMVAVGLDLKSPEAGRALVRAAESGHLAVVTLLVEEGVALEMVEGDVAPIARARANGHDAVVAFLDATMAARRAAADAAQREP